ncbi:MAG: GNAT family N-acetyltransferase [Erysipelotrichaceae bacterium]|nr:GNAT family N-acetyltransferase [Erysipelotrichaceae bacterium]
MKIAIEPGDNQLPVVRQLFSEYLQELALDLCFQHIDEELRDPTKIYPRPRGLILIAYTDDQPAGCIALKPLDNQRGEVKRLYVRPERRNLHLGQQLLKVLIDEAAALGYTELYLDTLDSLKPAVSLYQKMGFERTKPYYDNPLPNVLYFRKILTRN